MPIEARATAYMRQGGLITGLQDLIAKLPAGLVMAEIGVFAGQSTRIFMGSRKVKRLYAIDPWAGDYEQDDGVWHCPFEWEDVYDTFLAYADEHPEITVMRTSSLSAAAAFQNASLDFAYIDGNHAYNAVLADIAAWRPKIRPGGFLGGHDLSPAYPGVAQALLDSRLGWRHVFVDTSWLVQL